MLHTSTVPHCVATVLSQCNFHHPSNDLQLSKGVPTSGLPSDTLERIRIGSNISHITIKFTTTFYVYTYVKGNTE